MTLRHKIQLNAVWKIVMVVLFIYLIITYIFYDPSVKHAYLTALFIIGLIVEIRDLFKIHKKSRWSKTGDLQTLVRPNIRELEPYSTARDEFKGDIGIFLDANESPYPTGWNRYPDPHQKALKERISQIKGIPAQQIFLGNGSDEAIDLIFRVFCIPSRDNVVAIEPSYGMYSVCADINDIEVRSVRLNEDFSLPTERILKACDIDTKAIFLCSPNNPTGNSFPREEIIRILDTFHGIVVVDEAYIHFSSQPSLIPLIETHPNLIILQTFSKARGLAALRLGLAFSCHYTIGLMSRVKYPYNINASTQRIALEALENPIDEEVKTIVAERGKAAARLAEYPFITKVYPSDANFILVRTDDADSLYGHLLKDGIIVRNRNRVPGCAGCLRITVGLPEENGKLFNSFDNYKKE